MTTKNRKKQNSGLEKVPGYFRLFGRYVSKRFIFGLSLILVIAGILYLTLIHERVVQFWYEKQELPEFTLDSPYLTGYTGRARLLLSDGSLLYEGDINEAVIEGNGKLYQDYILIYEGAFLDGQYSGTGNLYSDTGSLLYSGEFAENLYHGKGLLYNEHNSVIYDGVFENGQRHGAGIQYDEKGDIIYSGMFEKDLYHGEGTLHFTEKGKVYTYSGSFIEGIKSGTGRLLQGNKLLYEGDFANGLYEGQGKLHNGEKLYDGAFAAGLYDGVGKLYLNGSLMYDGEFAAGLYNGAGIEYNTKTGHKVFEGRYLAGERMAAGVTYDENGEAPIVLPEYLDPLSLLSSSYEDVCTALTKADVNYRLIPSLPGVLLLIDDAGGVVYSFILVKDTEEPGYLTKIYLCNLSAAGGIVVGTDTNLIQHNVYATSAPGTLPGTEENFALELSNRYWSRSAEITDIGSISYIVEDKLITAYYLPHLTSEPTIPDSGQIVGEGEPVVSAPEPQPVRPGGLILFLKMEYHLDGGGE